MKGTLGLNTRVHPSRLSTSDDGLVELAEAVNIDISDRYKPFCRKGQVNTAITDSVHSFYDAEVFGLCVSGTSLLKVSTSYTSTTLKSDLTPGMTMSYAKQAGKVFYCNGYENGYVEDGSDHPWINPISQYDAVDSARTFSEPPVGHRLLNAFGRIWIAQDNILWFTEPFSPLLIDLARNAIPFNSRIREIFAVSDGIFVSTNNKTFFLSGSNPFKMTQFEVCYYPVVSHTVVKATLDDMPDFADFGLRNPIYIGTTVHGICIFGNGGFFKNLTKHTIDMPTITSGSAYLYNGKYVISFS